MINSTSNKIRLFAFSSGWGVPFNTAAPFPLKLETWLRMADIPYEFVVADDPNKGPKGKSPWIEHGSMRMGDSSLIIEYLEKPVIVGDEYARTIAHCAGPMRSSPPI